MSPDFSISINGATAVSCAAAGWSVGTVTRRNLDADSITLSRVLRLGADSIANTIHPISKGNKVVVFLAGERIFTGTAQSPSQSYDESTATTEIELLGPWWNLSQQTFVLSPFTSVGVVAGVTPTLGTEITITNTAGPTDGSFSIWNPSLNDGLGGWEIPSASSVTYKWGRGRYNGVGLPTLDVAGTTSTYGWLCGSRTFGGTTVVESVQTALWRVLEVTRLDILSLGSPALFAVDGLSTFVAPLGAAVYHSRITHSDRKVTDLITELLSVMPDVVLVWDYSLAVPKMQFKRAAEGIERTYTLGVPPLATARLSALDNMVPRGVIVRHERSDILLSGFTYPRRPLIYMEKWPEDTLMHDQGALCHTVPYTVGDFISQGVARTLYESLSTLRTAGSLTLKGLTPTQALALVPGTTVNLSGDLQLETAQSLIQEVTWAVATNTVTLKSGYPKRLGLDGLTDTRTYLARVLDGRTDS